MDIPGHESILWVQMWWLDQRDLHVSQEWIYSRLSRRAAQRHPKQTWVPFGWWTAQLVLSRILFSNSSLSWTWFWGCSREESFIAEERRAVPHMSRQNCKLWLHGLWCHEIPFRRDMRPNLHEMHVMRPEPYSRCPLSALMKSFGWPFGQNHCFLILMLQASAFYIESILRSTALKI